MATIETLGSKTKPFGDALTIESRGNAAAVASTRPRLKSKRRGPLRPDHRSDTHVHPQRMAKGTRTDAVASASVGLPDTVNCSRSEERRVGKECRARWSPYH